MEDDFVGSPQQRELERLGIVLHHLANARRLWFRTDLQRYARSIIVNVSRLMMFLNVPASVKLCWEATPLPPQRHLAESDVWLPISVSNGSFKLDLMAPGSQMPGYRSKKKTSQLPLSRKFSCGHLEICGSECLRRDSALCPLRSK